ncbi:hypothetical protein [Cellvibrio mixtus]|uniref:hypothetical protein n=1 Tax=Cellvibrio mixtus TaxID=39650 RepID=UPI000587E269|nr:hypothetical protein [Cellvibrio mixtus]
MSKLIAKVCWLVSIIVSMPVLAQAQASEANPAPPAAATSSADNQKAPAENTGGQKTIREANINLRTTVTGNQEQPRVMYILPWQSPASPDLEMEMLSSQQESVFGHVEREEFTRELEATDELDEF